MLTLKTYVNWDLVHLELSIMESGGEQMLRSSGLRKVAFQGDHLNKSDWCVGNLITTDVFFAFSNLSFWVCNFCSISYDCLTHPFSLFRVTIANEPCPICLSLGCEDLFRDHIY